MNKRQFLHEMREVATIMTVLKKLDKRSRRKEVTEIRSRLYDRVNALLDLGYKHLPEATDL